MPCCNMLQTWYVTVKQPHRHIAGAMQEARQMSGGGERTGPVQFALEVGHDFLALLSCLQQQTTAAYTRHASSSKRLHAQHLNRPNCHTMTYLSSALVTHPHVLLRLKRWCPHLHLHLVELHHGLELRGALLLVTPATILLPLLPRRLSLRCAAAAKACTDAASTDWSNVRRHI